MAAAPPVSMRTQRSDASACSLISLLAGGGAPVGGAACQYAAPPPVNANQHADWEGLASQVAELLFAAVPPRVLEGLDAAQVTRLSM